MLLVINIAGPILTWRMMRLNSDLERSKAQLSTTVVQLSKTAGDLTVSRNEAQNRAAENLRLAQVAQTAGRREARAPFAGRGPRENRAVDVVCGRNEPG